MEAERRAGASAAPARTATIGIYRSRRRQETERNLATAWWLALVVGLVVTGPTAVAGLIDWLGIQRGSPLWRTASSHLLAMVSATVFFLLAAIVGHGGYVDGEVTGGALILTLIGFGLLTLGGWLGGTIVFVHGMRVLNLVDVPTQRAAAPVPLGEKEAAAGGRARPEGPDR